MNYKFQKTLSFITAYSILLTSASCGSRVERNSVRTEISDTADTSEENSFATANSHDSPSETGASAAADNSSYPASEPPKSASKGSIYDTDGRLLISGEYGKRVYADDYAVSFGNVATEMSDGYDRAFNDILISSDNSGTANCIAVTLDAEVQNAVYSYMQTNNIKGACVAMRTDGSILAQVSYPSYDPRTVSETKYDEELAWGEFGNKAFQNYEPGSCFKIMSEVIADKHGVFSLTDEGEWEFDGTSIVNWDYETNFSYPIERSLSSAFVNSSNIFFAKAFDLIGSDAVLSDLDSIFHFVTDIKCDFGDLQNNIEIYCNDDLRRTAFGQAYVLTSPIYLAVLGREAVFGDMVRPFVLQNINGKTASAGNEVIASIPEELRYNLLEGMNAVGGNLSVYVPDGYSLYAKTGTAETWLGDFLYITGCVKNNNGTGMESYNGNYSNYAENGSYIIVMMVQNPGDHGFEFASESASLYQGLINTIVGS